MEFIDSMLFPERKICHLMGDVDRGKRPPQWDNALFWYNQNLPERLELTQGNFFTQSFYKKYSSLLRFGHSSTRKIVDGLENDEVLDSYELRDGQKQLRELICDYEALGILQKAAVLQPRITEEPGDYLFVEYKSFNGNE